MYKNIYNSKQSAKAHISYLSKCASMWLTFSAQKMICVWTDTDSPLKCLRAFEFPWWNNLRDPGVELHVSLGLLGNKQMNTRCHVKGRRTGWHAHLTDSTLHLPLVTILLLGCRNQLPMGKLFNRECRKWSFYSTGNCSLKNSWLLSQKTKRPYKRNQNLSTIGLQWNGFNQQLKAAWT